MKSHLSFKSFVFVAALICCVLSIPMSSKVYAQEIVAASDVQASDTQSTTDPIQPVTENITLDSAEITNTSAADTSTELNNQTSLTTDTVGMEDSQLIVEALSTETASTLVENSVDINTSNISNTNSSGVSTPLVVTVDSIVTTNHHQTLTGTVNNPNAIVEITICNQTHIAANLGDGRWELKDELLIPFGSHGIFDVIAKATLDGSSALDSTKNELTLKPSITSIGKKRNLNYSTNRAFYFSTTELADGNMVKSSSDKENKSSKKTSSLDKNNSKQSKNSDEEKANANNTSNGKKLSKLITGSGFQWLLFGGASASFLWFILKNQN